MPVTAHGGTFPMLQWDVYPHTNLGKELTVFTNFPAIAFVAVYPMETEAMLWQRHTMDTFIARGGEEEQKIT